MSVIPIEAQMSSSKKHTVTHLLSSRAIEAMKSVSTFLLKVEVLDHH